jgi:uncharacterized membrane protein YhaH (DUF805 family)
MPARNWVLLLLIVPFVGVLYPPFYASLQPEWQGIPYFIWYQFAWTVITSVLTIVVYVVHGRRQADEHDRSA